VVPSGGMQPMAARLCFVASLLALAASGAPLAQPADTPLAIVPLPAKIERGRGSFTLGGATPVVADASLRPQAHQLAAMLRPATGFALPVRIGASPRGPHLALRLDSQLARTLGPEGYRLTATSRAVTISAGAAAGVFYGMQSLRQLLPAAIFEDAPVRGMRWVVPAVTIEDVPRFSWRGAHLDVSRHFQPKEFVRKYIDLLALHKMNRFHWHLTDDQGWRVEIKRYPKLTGIAAWRKETIVGANRDGPDAPFDGVPHGGYYTQEEIREIVAYAAERFIIVVPEIEMPGHSQAVVAAYPELGSTDQPTEPRTRWGVSPFLLNLDDSTIAFMQNVLVEVLDLFPGPWIHIGGDEAVKTQWRENPNVQARIKSLGLANEDEAQSWFIRQMDTFLTARGRRLIGWDEILEGGLAPNATVMSWRGIEGAIAAARSGHDAVLTPTSHTYFDYRQSTDTAGEPLAIGGFIPLERVYTWEPMPEGLEADFRRHILGVQGQLWTEYMPNPRQVEYMAFPRLTALAEVAWTPADRRELEEFRGRLAVHLGRLRALDVNFRPADLERPAYKDRARPIDERVSDLLRRMTIEEKFWQLFMIPGDLDDPSHDYSHGAFGLQIRNAATAREHATRINAIQRFFVRNTRLGIPIIPFEEALHGVTMPEATVFPQAIALAATWDPALVGRVADAIARETRTRGVRQVLSPVLNIADDVRWGRVEETYGEDPFLASVMARAFIAPFERAGVVATPKHFVANAGEGGRDSYPIQYSERLLIERYFPPFEAAIREGARSVMAAYNSVDGSPATQNRWLLTDVLKGRWGFRGFVISDAAATGGATVLHMTEANTGTAAKHAIEAGLDVIFQSSWPQHRPYLTAFTRGEIDRAAIDAAVTRVLRIKFELGLFEQPFVNVDQAADWNGQPEHLARARLAARKSIALLRNEGRALPLAKTLRNVAVIGDDAREARLGGYSGSTSRKVSIQEGITPKLGAGATVRYAAGPGRGAAPVFVQVPSEALSTGADGKIARGLRGEYFDNNQLAGSPRLQRVDEEMDFRWTLNSPGRGIPFDWYSARWTGTLTAPASGVARIGLEGNDGYRLYIDRRLVIDNWRKQSYGRRITDVHLLPASTHDIRLEYFESTGNARLKLIWDTGVADDGVARIEEAVQLARASDVAIVVAGIEEGEFRDRAFLSLPGRQEDLIRAVAATRTPTIVVLVGGSAIAMSSWIDAVAGVVDVWYPGEQGGHAVADVLFGDENPAGRLPITFPMAEGQLPLYYNHKPTGRGDDYVDLTGMPLFPFGFGLSYTTFEYSDLRIEPSAIDAAGTVAVRCRITNTGARAGDEVVQLYVRDVLATVARPVMELRGFTRIHLRPAESRDVTFALGSDDLRMLGGDLRWVVEPGAFRVMIGASSEDIRLRGEFTVK
jgi:beta-glucosidase